MVTENKTISSILKLRGNNHSKTDLDIEEVEKKSYWSSLNGTIFKIPQNTKLWNTSKTTECSTNSKQKSKYPKQIITEKGLKKQF